MHVPPSFEAGEDSCFLEPEIEEARVPLLARDSEIDLASPCAPPE